MFKSSTCSLIVSIIPRLAEFSSISKNLFLSRSRDANLNFTFAGWIVGIGGLMKWLGRSAGDLPNTPGGGIMSPLSPIGGITPIGGIIIPLGGTRGIMGFVPPTSKLGGKGANWLWALLLSLLEVSVCFLILSSVSLAFFSASLSFLKVFVSMLMLKMGSFSL